MDHLNDAAYHQQPAQNKTGADGCCGRDKERNGS